MESTQIRVVSSTRNSITLNWDSGGEMGDEEKFVLQVKDRILGWTSVYSFQVRTGIPKWGNLSGVGLSEFRTRNTTLFTIFKAQNLKPDYFVLNCSRGYKREVEIKSLKPGECFQFRLKKKSPFGETDWTESVYAATKDEAIPLAHLFRAVQNSHAVNTKKIISQRPSILNTPNKFNQTPLQLSVSHNDLDMVNVLLSNGADINGPETGSWRTPLMIAAFRGYLDIVKILIDKGSRWEDKDRNEMTALHYAADNSHFDIVRFAVEDGAHINAKDIFGWTPVMRAVILKASPQIIEYLLENGSDVNETDINDQTLLMLAVLSGRPDIVRLVLSKNADTSMKNTNGHTARDMAQASSNKEIRKLCNLLGAGTDSDRTVRRSRWSGKDARQ